MLQRSSPDHVSKATFSSSRRNFLKGARLALGTGVALGMSATFGTGARAMGSLPLEPGNGRPHGRGKEHCFLAGTRIQTPSGPVAVEDLSIGDSVLTASGGAKPIKWIGKRMASSEAPVKIAKFAIDGEAPLRDLYVTPAHAIYIDGFLIPAINLVNDITIIANSKSTLSTFAYYHIEFDAHEVIQAEGLLVESYLPEDSVYFDNADEYLALYGPHTQPVAPFAPVLSHKGRKEKLASYARGTIACVYDMRNPLDKIRDRLADQAELRRAA